MRLLLVAGCVVGASLPAAASPLNASLGAPRLSLALALGQTPPPVVLPDAPATPDAVAPGGGPVPSSPAPWTDGLDHLRLRDGRELRGRILSEVKDGYLFDDRGSNTTFVVPFDQVADLQRPGVPPRSLAPTLTPGSSSERRFLLEAELRDLSARYEAVTIRPGIEEIAAGVLGLGLGAVLFAVIGTSDTVSLIFAGLAGATGAISLIGGTVSLVSAENQKAALSGDIAKVQDQLSRLPPLAQGPPLRGERAVAFRF